MSYLPQKPDSVFSTVNNTTTPLGIGGIYTGTYESLDYVDILVSVVADVDLDYWIDLSSNGTTADVSVPFNVRGGGINYPHRLTVGPRYVRLRIENNSGTAATFTTGNIQHGAFNDLAIGQHRIAAQDNDATIVRPTDFRIETALGLRDGISTIRLFGANRDVDVASSEEVVATFGSGPISLANDVMRTAQTFDITYTNTLDGSTSQGALTLEVEYLDANKDLQTATHTLGSTGTDTTAFSGLGINHVKVATAGTTYTNGGDITFTPTTSGNVQSQVAAGDGISSGVVFHVPRNYSLEVDDVHVNALKLAGGSAPKATFRLYVYDRSTDVSRLVDEVRMDTDVINEIDQALTNPFAFGPETILFMSAATDVDNLNVTALVTGILHKV